MWWWTNEWQRQRNAFARACGASGRWVFLEGTEGKNGRAEGAWWTARCMSVCRGRACVVEMAMQAWALECFAAGRRVAAATWIWLQDCRGSGADGHVWCAANKRRQASEATDAMRCLATATQTERHTRTRRLEAISWRGGGWQAGLAEAGQATLPSRCISPGLASIFLREPAQNNYPPHV